MRRKEDVTQATEKVFASLRGLYRGEDQRVPVSLALEAGEGQVTLTARDKEGQMCIRDRPSTVRARSVSWVPMWFINRRRHWGG